MPGEEVTCVDFSIDRGEAGFQLWQTSSYGLQFVLEGQASVTLSV